MRLLSPGQQCILILPDRLWRHSVLSAMLRVSIGKKLLNEWPPFRQIFRCACELADTRKQTRVWACLICSDTRHAGLKWLCGSADKTSH